MKGEIVSRYIDAEWLIKESMPLSFSVQKWVNEVQIMTAPSIDIVRCGECIYWKNSLCQAWHRVIPKDGYCSIGERESE